MEKPTVEIPDAELNAWYDSLQYPGQEEVEEMIRRFEEEEAACPLGEAGE